MAQHLSKPLVYGTLGALYAIGLVKQKIDRDANFKDLSDQSLHAGQEILKNVPTALLNLANKLQGLQWFI